MPWWSISIWEDDGENGIQISKEDIHLEIYLLSSDSKKLEIKEESWHQCAGMKGEEVYRRFLGGIDTKELRLFAQQILKMTDPDLSPEINDIEKKKCPSCGSTQMRQSSTDWICMDCGFTTWD